MLILAMGMRRPFIWVLVYLYVDIISPQKITYHMLNAIPISLIAFILAVMGWLIFDRKENVHFTGRQALILMLLIYCGITTQTADFATEAAEKWAWVWKSLVFAMFLPMTLRTRLRIEAAALVMCLAAGGIVICGAIKSLLGGGGYAEYAVCDARHALPIPAGLDFVQAAGLPETVFTVFANVFEHGRR